jgi:hypothetical protein
MMTMKRDEELGCNPNDIERKIMSMSVKIDVIEARGTIKYHVTVEKNGNIIDKVATYRNKHVLGEDLKNDVVESL